MAACNVQTLMRDASCFTCVPPGFFQPLKLALLCQWLHTLNPAADCSVSALMRSAQCFVCLSPGEWQILKLQLYCNLANGGGGGDCVAPFLNPGDWTVFQFGAMTVEADLLTANVDACTEWNVRWSFSVDMSGSTEVGPATLATAITFGNVLFSPGSEIFIQARLENCPCDGDWSAIKSIIFV